MIEKSPLLLFLLAGLVMITVSSCHQKETKYEFYDLDKKSIKTEAEYLDGLLDGFLIFYYPDGKKKEIGEWKKGVRDGLTLTFHPNGKEAGRYVYKMGKVRGEYRLYYQSGTLKKIGHIDNNDFFYDTKNYDEDGKLLEVTPYFSMNSDTLSLGDTLKITGTLENIDDPKYFSGSMILASQFASINHDFLKDTIAISSSTFNIYSTSFIPNKRGTNRFIVQIVLQFKTDEKYNEFSVDSLAFFSTEGSVFVK